MASLGEFDYFLLITLVCFASLYRYDVTVTAVNFTIQSNSSVSDITKSDLDEIEKCVCSHTCPAVGQQGNQTLPAGQYDCYVFREQSSQSIKCVHRENDVTSETSNLNNDNNTYSNKQCNDSDDRCLQIYWNTSTVYVESKQCQTATTPAADTFTLSTESLQLKTTSHPLSQRDTTSPTGIILISVATVLIIIGLASLVAFLFIKFYNKRKSEKIDQSHKVVYKSLENIIFDGGKGNPGVSVLSASGHNVQAMPNSSSKKNDITDNVGQSITTEQITGSLAVDVSDEPSNVEDGGVTSVYSRLGENFSKIDEPYDVLLNMKRDLDKEKHVTACDLTNDSDSAV